MRGYLGRLVRRMLAVKCPPMRPSSALWLFGNIGALHLPGTTTDGSLWDAGSLKQWNDGGGSRRPVCRTRTEGRDWLSQGFGLQIDRDSSFLKGWGSLIATFATPSLSSFPDSFLGSFLFSLLCHILPPSPLSFSLLLLFSCASSY